MSRSHSSAAGPSSSLEQSLAEMLRKLRSPQILWPILLTVLTLALYGRTLSYQFINFDDDAHVYENPDVQSGLSLKGLFWAFEIHGPSQWHPLAWISHQLDWQLYGADPAGHHATNVLLHWVGVLLLFRAINQLFRRPLAAAFIASLFAVHPLNLESVVWVSERRNVLCGVFWMATLISYGRYSRQVSLRQYSWVTLWLCLALMSKPLAVTLPCVLMLLDFWPLRRWNKQTAPKLELAAGAADVCPSQSLSRLIVEKLPWLFLSAGASWLSYLCQAKIHVVSDLASLPWSLRLENSCIAYALYVRRMFWPMDLAVFYPHPAWTAADPQQDLLIPAAISLLVLLVMTAWALWYRKKHPGLILGWCWFLGTLVPMIGLVQVGRQQLADRYAYVPMIGLGVMLAAFPWPRRMLKFVPPLGGMLIAFWFTISCWQIGYWENSQRLFARAIAVTEQNSWAHLNLGQSLQSEGSVAEAIEQYQLALAIDPQYALAHYNLGVAWHDRGRLDLAIPRFQSAVGFDPTDVKAWLRLGGALGQAGQLDSAEECFRKALELDQNSGQAWFNLAIVLQAKEDPEGTLNAFLKAVNVEPANTQFRTGLMLALWKSGQHTEAQEQARTVLQTVPGSREAKEVLQSGAPRR